MAASVPFGKVGEFSPEKETFSAYVERVEMFFTANGIVEGAGERQEAANELVKERQRAIFLTEVGPEVYSTLSNLVAPMKPKEIPLTKIIECLEMSTIRVHSRLPKVYTLAHVIKSKVNP